MAWLTRAQLRKLDFASLGQDVRISDRCALHGSERMRLGDHVRIDDWTVLTADEELRIGSHVHLGAQVFVSGARGVEIGDFSGLSPGVAVFSASDDFSGVALTGPTIPDEFRRVDGGRVVVGRHCIVGARSILLPGVRLGDGVAVGCLSLVTEDLRGWAIYAGIPARRIKARSKAMLRLEAKLAARTSRRDRVRSR